MHAFTSFTDMFGVFLSLLMLVFSLNNEMSYSICVCTKSINKVPVCRSVTGLQCMPLATYSWPRRRIPGKASFSSITRQFFLTEQRFWRHEVRFHTLSWTYQVASVVKWSSHCSTCTEFSFLLLLPLWSIGLISQFLDHLQTVGLLGRVISSSQGLLYIVDDA
jgi:hypothetical protein